VTGDGRKAGGRAPVDDATKARVVQLAREGMTRNAVAREVGIAPRTVSRICDAAVPPVTFDRAQTAVAVAAHSMDAKAQRALLSQRMLTEANAALDRLHEPHVVIGWYQGMASEHVLANPAAADVRAYMLAAAVAVDRHMALERHDGSDLELSAVDQFIRDVSRGILT